MPKCDTCKANKVCDHNKYGFENCGNYIPGDVVSVVKCKDCAGAEEHPASPAMYKCNGCNFIRGRLVSKDFWCKCGKRKEGEKSDR